MDSLTAAIAGLEAKVEAYTNKVAEGAKSKAK
jgi:hypothetical protein